ncbi:MAG: prephenate dehydratase [Gammaproteobacteria bacterium]|jgi:chorismate mutase/prephenate dehydratase
MSDAKPDNVDLAEIRARIDRLDEQIQQLISERARAAQVVGTSKLGDQARPRDFYRPEREAQVLRKVVDRNEGPLRDEEMVRLFREIMSACLAQQEPLKVAFLGPEGTFTQAAVLKHFGHSVRALSLSSIDEVFHEVESGVADFGIVPVENSTEGTVNNTLDMFMTSPLRICGEVELRIRQHLLGTVEGLDHIERVYSHQQSLAQCRAWLEQKLPGAECIAVSSNAEAARLARDEEGAAAIAGEAAAEVYGLRVLMANIEDRPDNTTRFLVIGRDLFPPSGRDKTSLLLAARHKAGALHEILYPLAKHQVSMTRIESRPSKRGKWDYVFFVDVEGHAEDPKIADALKDLEVATSLFRVLGSYPCAIL